MFTRFFISAIIHVSKKQIYAIKDQKYVILIQMKGRYMLNKNEFPAFPIIEQIHITSIHSLFKIHYECGFEFSGETHDFWECLCILDGELCVSADERIYNMTKGEIIFHKPLEFHKFIVNHPTGATLFIFSFSAGGPLTFWLQNKVFKLSQNQIDIIKSLLEYAQNKADLTNTKKTVYDYYLHSFAKFPSYSQMIANYLGQLFLDLAEEGTLSSVSSAPDAVTFRNAICFLNDKLDCQPTVSEIAKHCNISDASLERIFDKYAGISVHKYLLKLKINVAKKMLQDGTQISCVAENLGFTSQSYFSKVFKRETGVPPSEFAKFFQI